jgi:D-alanine-D-alanine ligase
VKITLLHTSDADGPPEDPVLAQVESALAANGHTVQRVVADEKVEPLLRALEADRPELVFNLCESFGGKSALESNVAGLLNLIDLRYTGSSPAGLLVAGDKSLTKKILRFHGIATPEFATVYRGRVEWAGDVKFPLIVKPPQEDASIGLSQRSIVRDVKELLERIAELQAEFNQPALAEEFIEGREFYVGVLGNESARALPVIELDFSKLPAKYAHMASWEAKWGDDGEAKGAEYEGTRSIFPESLDDELRERMQRIAVECFHALRLRDYARIDLRVNAAGEVFVIEVNPNCYLERESEFSRAAARDGMSHEALIAEIVRLASGRYAR